MLKPRGLSNDDCVTIFAWGRARRYCRLAPAVSNDVVQDRDMLPQFYDLALESFVARLELLESLLRPGHYKGFGRFGSG